MLVLCAIASSRDDGHQIDLGPRRRTCCNRRRVKIALRLTENFGSDMEGVLVLPDLAQIRAMDFSLGSSSFFSVITSAANCSSSLVRATPFGTLEPLALYGTSRVAKRLDRGALFPFGFPMSRKVVSGMTALRTGSMESCRSSGVEPAFLSARSPSSGLG